MYKSHTWPIYSVGSTCREPSVNNNTTCHNVPQRALPTALPHHHITAGQNMDGNHQKTTWTDGKTVFFLLLFVSVPRDFSAISNHPAPTFQASGSGSGFNSTVEIPMSSSAAFFNKHSTDPSHLDAGKARAKWELPNQPRITRPGKHTKNYGKIHHF